MASVIVGENIDRFRLLTIASALRLESKGLKGKIKASVIARQILKANGIVPAKLLVELCEQFKNFVVEKNKE